MVSDAYIKEKIQKLYKNQTNIRLTAVLPRYPLKLIDVEATIVGVYAHIFAVEVVQNGWERRFFFQYGEIITHNVVIEELDLI